MAPLDRSRPFVLLDNARPGGQATLFREPAGLIVAHRPDEVAAALDALDRPGPAAAGFLSYEAGAALEPRLAPLARTPDPAAPPLLWFGMFDHVETLDPDALAALLGDPDGAHAAAPEPLVDEAWHADAVARVKALIAAGDIYQANLTYPSRVAVAGDPLALYARLRRQGGGWGGVVFTGAHWLLSASPELFFTLEDGVATARPMKGTARRDPDPVADSALAGALAADPKQRAENLMIVDLIRNDLARIARPGGVTVEAAFAVETYPTVHQMTSTVRARTRADVSVSEAIRSLFPCGSITGAPKIRAMQVIDVMEERSRGPYTGSIGRISPERDGMAFNVAIRTLVMERDGDHAVVGLGSAITADSVASDEWDECRVKGGFVTDGARPFDLIETIRFDADEGFVELERHLARMKGSADTLGFAFDRHQVRNELQAASFMVRHDAAVRLRCGREGEIAIEMRPLPREPDWPAPVRLMPLPVAPADFRLRHKTSDRGFYDRARNAAGTFEVALVDGEGFVTEGSFTNIFVERDGQLLTPPLSRGLIPGTLRERLIDEGRARETDLRPEDLDHGFLIGNALRGLIPARLVA